MSKQAPEITTETVAEWSNKEWAEALRSARNDLMMVEDFDPDDIAHVMECAAVKLLSIGGEQDGEREALESLRFALENAEGSFMGIRANLMAHRAGAHVDNDPIEASIGVAEYAAGEIRAALASQPAATEERGEPWVSDSGRSAVEVALALADVTDPQGQVGDALDLLAYYQERLDAPASPEGVDPQEPEK